MSITVVVRYPFEVDASATTYVGPNSEETRWSWSVLRDRRMLAFSKRSYPSEEAALKAGKREAHRIAKFERDRLVEA